MKSAGMYRLVSIDGVAAATSVDMQPDTGCEWTIVWAYGYHDDNAGAHNLCWRYTDSNTELAGAPITITFNAVNVALNLGISMDAWRGDASSANTTKHPEPIQLNHNIKATLVSDAMGAGKKLYIRAMVIERRGIGS